MNVRRWVVRAGECAIMALAAVPIRGFAGDVPPDAHAQMRAAMDWLATPWSEAQQKTLEARQPPKDPKALLHLPGSTQTYRREQLSQIVPDWWPHDHPPMPTIVAAGRGKGMPCGECHGPTGAGEPHTATLMGLPAAYIIEQVRAFRDGSRANDEMHFEASHVSDADVQQAAAYFTGLHLAAARARVIEAARGPARREDHAARGQPRTSNPGCSYRPKVAQVSRSVIGSSSCRLIRNVYGWAMPVRASSLTCRRAGSRAGSITTTRCMPHA